MIPHFILTVTELENLPFRISRISGNIFNRYQPINGGFSQLLNAPLCNGIIIPIAQRGTFCGKVLPSPELRKE